jgi:hypothetical protein
MSIILYQDFDGVNKKCEPLMPTLQRRQENRMMTQRGLKGGCLTMRNNVPTRSMGTRIMNLSCPRSCVGIESRMMKYGGCSRISHDDEGLCSHAERRNKRGSTPVEAALPRGNEK